MPERFAATSASLGMLNATIYMGAWFLNESKGEVIFRVTLPTTEIEAGDRAVHFVASLAISTAEKLAGAIAAVALKGAEPSAVRAWTGRSKVSPRFRKMREKGNGSARLPENGPRRARRRKRSRG